MAKSTTAKTQAMRVLDARKIAYVTSEYDASREFHSAEEAAALIGAPATEVYKTLVVLRDTPARAKPMLVMVASDREIDLRLLAKAVGEKKVRMATQREAETLTGLQVGGISALALLNRNFEVLIDAAARTLARVHISAGVRGIDLEIAVGDLVAVTDATFVAATAG